MLRSLVGSEMCIRDRSDGVRISVLDSWPQDSPPRRLVISRWLAFEHNQCQTLVSALAPMRKITQAFTLPSGAWFTSTLNLLLSKSCNFKFPHLIPVGCRPMTLMAYSLNFCTNWDTYAFICTEHMTKWQHNQIYTCKQIDTRTDTPIHIHAHVT